MKLTQLAQNCNFSNFHFILNEKKYRLINNLIKSIQQKNMVWKRKRRAHIAEDHMEYFLLCADRGD